MAASSAQTVEEQIADRVVALADEEIPANVRHTLERSILDSYAGICGSLRDTDMLRRFDQLVDIPPAGADAAVWGTGRNAHFGDAVFANAILGRRSDLLNTYISPNGMGGAHPSDNVGLVLTLAEWLGMTGEQVLATAHVAFWLSGTYATYYDPETVGYDHDAAATFITALTIGQAVGLSRDDLVLAQRIAGMFGLDTNEAADGEMTDWKHCTYASCAVRGLLAVRYARAGFEAPAEIYRGVYGDDRFFRHADNLFEPPVDLTEIIFKRWPALVFCQTPIDVALDLAGRVTDPASVTDIEVRTYHIAAHNGATSGAWAPDSRAGRTHSIPYCVATALLKPIEYEDFDERRSADPMLRALMAKTRVVDDDSMDDLYPDGAPCAITVTFEDGTTQTATRDRPVGDPGDPLSDDQLEEKLRAQFWFGPDEQLEAALGCLRDLGSQANVEPLLAPLRTRRI